MLYLPRKWRMNELAGGGVNVGDKHKPLEKNGHSSQVKTQNSLLGIQISYHHSKGFFL